jgi:hypothetical protein
MHFLGPVRRWARMNRPEVQDAFQKQPGQLKSILFQFCSMERAPPLISWPKQISTYTLIHTSLSHSLHSAANRTTCSSALCWDQQTAYCIFTKSCSWNSFPLKSHIHIHTHSFECKQKTQQHSFNQTSNNMKNLIIWHLKTAVPRL